ncbi:hypothetical protein ACQPXS_35655 [Streptomyces sp. CA-142005]|uniref:hypothetical protein n=1 Tax=Streptomyces sp. CA-142005 TaxID=3240052 RepID=UPI003D8F8FDF
MTRSTRRGLPLAFVALLLTTACTAAADTGAATNASPSPPPAPTPSADAVVRTVPAAQWQKMKDAGMVRSGCPVTSREQLVRVEVNHHGFEIHRGVLVVNAETVVRIFTRLFDEEFPIRQMKPLEGYGGDNTASLAADNTATYNCRRANQIRRRGLDLAGHRRGGLHALRHRLSVEALRRSPGRPAFASRRPGLVVTPTRRSRPRHVRCLRVFAAASRAGRGHGCRTPACGPYPPRPS